MHGLAEDINAFSEATKVRPLCFWRGWDQDAPRTSQRRALAQLQYTREIGYFGGNRSGKTEMCRAAVVALLNGSDHPDSRAFWLNNGCDPDAFPRGPDSGWAIAVSSGDSLRYHRRQILALIPKWGPRHPNSEGSGQNWHAWNLFGKGESRLQWMVPGYDDPAEIWFKSEDQEIMTFQGDAIRVAWHDEEGTTAHRYEQTQYRLIDKDGYQIMSDTPIHGRSWVYNRFVLKRDSRKQALDTPISMASIHTVDNPYLPKHRVAKVADDAVRGRGEFIVLSGRIWPDFDNRHEILPFDIPKNAYRFRAIDFGTRHPFVCLWGAMLRQRVEIQGKTLPEGSIIIYREHYAAEQTLKWHVEKIRTAEGWIQRPERVRTDDKTTVFRWIPDGERGEHIDGTWADPEDAQQMLQLNAEHGIDARPANKSMDFTISKVGEYLKPNEAGEVRLYVFNTCLETIRECQDWQWTKKMTDEGVEKDVPSKVNDHTCDALRYLVTGATTGFA